MYLIYCLLIWIFVYILPALAFFPRLIDTPYTAFAAPIISVFIIYIATTVLIALHIFTNAYVTLFAFGLGLIAFWRLYHLRKSPLFWTKQDVYIYAFHWILLFPYFIKLGTHAFDRGDEIYSWNFWAIQHFFMEHIDFSHTGAPYPQLFPKLLAFSYHIVGSIDLQLPVKATLIIFPVTMLTAIAMSLRQHFQTHVGVYWLLLGYVLAIVGLERFFNDGYADPVMTSCLIVSIALFWQSQQESLFATQSFKSLHFTPTGFAFLSVLCAICAAHAKQPGLLWAMFSLPVLLIMSYRHRRYPYFIWLSLLSLVGGLIWILGEGQQFHLNRGVLGLSFADRDVFAQLGFAMNKYFIRRPFLFVLFLCAVLASRREFWLKRMVLVFMVPSLLCWFLFGSYHLRLGQHLISFSFFVIAASGYLFDLFLIKQPLGHRLLSWCHLRQKQLLVVCWIISFSAGSLLFVKEFWIEKGAMSLYDGGRQSLHRYFGDDADHIYATIYKNPEALLWVPSRYLYGLFYRHTRLTTPDYSEAPYNTATLVKELQRKLPDYVFTVSPAIIDGPASECLNDVVQACPKAFSQISSADNRFNFITYSVNKEILQQDPCLFKLAQA